jgi:capsular exopolysaccharide synthesis family protein
MSEFFKALEQAERDRLQEDHAEAPSANAAPVSRPAARDNVTPVAPRPPAKATTPKTPAARPTPPRSLVERAETATAPVERRSADGAAPPPLLTRPEPLPAPASSPASTFRPSLRHAVRAPFRRRTARREPLLVTQTDPASVEANAYRTLRTNIELMADRKMFKHIAITSAGGGDGKSTTAANLAVVAAQSGRRVCLVDADFSRPTLHEVFGLPNVDGLAVALQGKPLHAVARASDVENLWVVVAGRGNAEAFRDVLTAERLERSLRESEAAYDLVIIDSPPVIAVADALSVAAVSDGVILVVRAGSIPFSVLRRTISQIKQVKGRVLGVLLNQANLRSADAASYHYYRGGRGPKSDPAA